MSEEVKQELETTERKESKAEEKKQENFSVMLMDKLNISGIPSNVNKERFVANALAVLNEHPEYMNFKRNDLIMGLVKGAVMGLDFLSKECYLICYGGKLNFQTDYKGDVKVAMRYSKRKIKDILSQVVRDGDILDIKVVDNNLKINFAPKPLSSEKVVGVIAYVVYEDGGADYEMMTTEEIEAIRQGFSKSKNSPAWTNEASKLEMYRKTCLRRLTKKITKDFEFAEQQIIYDESGDSDFSKVNAQQEKVKIIDITKEEE